MDMIRHDYRYVEFILRAMVMAAGFEHEITGSVGQNPAELGHERDEMGSGIFLDVWKISSVEQHGMIVSG